MNSRNPAGDDLSKTAFVLRDGNIVLPRRILPRGSLRIEDGQISSIVETDAHPDEVGSILDLNGLTLFPGFIDVHIHGAVGVDTMEAGPHEFTRVSKFLATQGVTGWLPTLVPAPVEDYEHAIAAIDAAAHGLNEELDAQSGARLLGVHYEGPFVNSAQCGALRSEYFRTYSGANDLEDLPLPASGDVAKMMTLAPEIKGGVELVRELKLRGWIVSIGHTRANFELLDRALDAGARHMTHFMNAMAPLHHRSPGPIAWGLARDEVTCDVIADGIHLDAQMLKLLTKLKGADRLTLISDAIAAAGLGDGDYRIWGETISVKDRRTSNVHGSIAGSVITMLDAVRLMISLGLSEVDVARMASTNPARLLGLDHECGSIEVGKRADLVAVNTQGEAVMTVIGGEVAYKKSER